MSDLSLILTAAGSIILLLFLVMKARLHAVVSLILVSMIAGVTTGMNPTDIAATIQKGMGGTLGFVAVVVALGAMFGKVMETTGALDRIAQTLLNRFGSERANWAITITGFICALPLFFDVAVVLLIGVVFAIVRKSKDSVVKMGIALLAGIATCQAFLIPAPGPILVASQLGADFGYMILIGLAACYLLGIKRGYDKDEVMNICGSALQPAGVIILVTGAGGVFKQVLVDSGVGQALGNMLAGSGLPIVALAFILAAAVRVIEGSATVAMLTACGLILPMLEPLGLSGAQLAAITVAIGGGSIVLSHVNDSGFWLANRYLGLTEKQTLQTWTVMETIIGTTGALVAMGFSLFL